MRKGRSGEPKTAEPLSSIILTFSFLDRLRLQSGTIAHYNIIVFDKTWNAKKGINNGFNLSENALQKAIFNAEPGPVRLNIQKFRSAQSEQSNIQSNAANEDAERMLEKILIQW